VTITPDSPSVPDSTPPTVPTNVQATATGTTSISVSWNASSDTESGVAGYRVYRDGGLVGTTAATNFSDTGLSASTTYLYSVSAYDNAVPSNSSLQSGQVAGTTDDESFVSVPNVVNQTQATAESNIESAGLVVGTVTSTNSATVAAGSVISQNPSGGTSVSSGSSVDLVISLGSAPVTVPNVLGQSLSTATTNLNNAGLSLGTVTRVTSASVPVDEVMDQDPDGGTQVANGSAVDLTVSDGPPAADTTPPSVPQNLTATAAGANRINLSWNASTDTGTGVAGYRIFQDGTPVATTASTSYAALGLQPVTNYTFTVTAYDNAAPSNESGQSAPANATTDSVALWSNQDIGAVAAAGSFVDNAGTLTMEASGADIWSSLDEFHFAYQILDGDGEIIARVESLGNTHDWAKAGVMMRASLNANSAHSMMIVTAVRGADLQYRLSNGSSSGPSGSVDGVTSAPTWLRLVRAGNVFTGYTSSDGVTWLQEDQRTVNLPTTVYVGLAATSHNDGVITTAVFDNVVVTPAP
jgi:hypothetical protein